LFSAFIVLAACSLTQSLDDYSSGKGDAGKEEIPGTCANTAEKSCGGTCRPTTDPQFGCALPTCAPCDLPHATTDGCDPSGRCHLAACTSGYDNCNGGADDGCEAKLDEDANHCGSCDVKCAGGTNAVGKCAGGKCGVESCATGFGNCNDETADGCEIDTQTDVAHCGDCKTPCPTIANSTYACLAGTCKLDSCQGNFRDCDKVEATGCECGFPNAQVICSDSSDAADASTVKLDGSTTSATCLFGGCTGSFANCNNNLPLDGCEIDTQTDPLNCGACGFSCDGGACIAGRCQPKQIIGNQSNPGQLVLDLDYAYWTNYGSSTTKGSIYRVRKDSLNPTLIADGNETAAWGIATNDTTGTVYWTTQNAVSHVSSALKVSGQATVLASTTGRLRGAALDGSYLYWANYEQNTIMRINVAAAGAQPETVAQAPTVARPNTIVFDATNVYWTNEGTPVASTSPGATPQSTPVTGSVIAMTKASIGTGSPAFTALVTTQDKPRGLVVDATNVYWTNATANGAVGRIAKDGSAAQVPTFIATNLGQPREVALCTGTNCESDPYLYVTAYTGGTILRLAKNAAAGSTPTILASGQKGPLGIASDAKYVFWANFATANVSDGTIMKLVKQP
jgi:hypothetical protein